MSMPPPAVVASRRDAEYLGSFLAQRVSWHDIPSWAVIGTEDRVISVAVQRSMAERAGATITEVAASHVSMVSHPEVTVDAIVAAAASLAP